MKKIPLFNPNLNSFSWEYKDSENVSHTAVMEGQEITYFEPWLAELMTKHLVDDIFHTRGVKVNPEIDQREIRKEIQIEL